MIETVDTTCQICGEEIFVSGEITPHSIEGSDGLSCDRCFYQKAFEYWKQVAATRQKLLREMHEVIVDEPLECPVCGVSGCRDDGLCKLAEEVSDEQRPV